MIFSSVFVDTEQGEDIIPSPSHSKKSLNESKKSNSPKVDQILAFEKPTEKGDSTKGNINDSDIDILANFDKCKVKEKKDLSESSIKEDKIFNKDLIKELNSPPKIYSDKSFDKKDQNFSKSFDFKDHKHDDICSKEKCNINEKQLSKALSTDNCILDEIDSKKINELYNYKDDNSSGSINNSFSKDSYKTNMKNYIAKDFFLKKPSKNDVINDSHQNEIGNFYNDKSDIIPKKFINDENIPVNQNKLSALINKPNIELNNSYYKNQYFQNGNEAKNPFEFNNQPENVRYNSSFFYDSQINDDKYISQSNFGLDNLNLNIDNKLPNHQMHNINHQPVNQNQLNFKSPINYNQQIPKVQNNHSPNHQCNRNQQFYNYQNKNYNFNQNQRFSNEINQNQFFNLNPNNQKPLNYYGNSPKVRMTNQIDNSFNNNYYGQNLNNNFQNYCNYNNTNNNLNRNFYENPNLRQNYSQYGNPMLNNVRNVNMNQFNENLINKNNEYSNPSPKNHFLVKNNSEMSYNQNNPNKEKKFENNHLETFQKFNNLNLEQFENRKEEFEEEELKKNLNNKRKGNNEKLKKSEIGKDEDAKVEKLKKKKEKKGKKSKIQKKGLNYLEMTDEKLGENSLIIAKEQGGCRYLQKKITEVVGFADNIIFPNIKNNIFNLINDSFGNYLVQKMVESISEENLTEFLTLVSDELFLIGSNPHGTRVLQRLIELLDNDIIIKHFINSIKAHIVKLVKDINGNHIIQKYITTKFDKLFEIFEILNQNLLEISTDKHGCCVIQKLIEFTSNKEREILFQNVVQNSIDLMYDQYGNYVIQYVIMMNNIDVNLKITNQFKSELVNLCQQKYSSNVIEKILEYSNYQIQESLFKEILKEEIFSKILFDQFGNYVIQRALSIAKEVFFNDLIKSIQKNSAELKKIPFGQKLFSKLAGLYRQLDENGEYNSSINKSKSLKGKKKYEN